MRTFLLAILILFMLGAAWEGKNEDAVNIAKRIAITRTEAMLRQCSPDMRLGEAAYATETSRCAVLRQERERGEFFSVLRSDDDVVIAERIVTIARRLEVVEARLGGCSPDIWSDEAAYAAEVSGCAGLRRERDWLVAQQYQATKVRLD